MWRKHSNQIYPDINRILLPQRNDDSLPAWCVEEGNLQTSPREACGAVEGNEARPAFIVLIGVGFPEDWTRLSWDLCLAKILLTHILFLFQSAIVHISNAAHKHAAHIISLSLDRCIQIHENRPSSLTCVLFPWSRDEQRVCFKRKALEIAQFTHFQSLWSRILEFSSPDMLGNLLLFIHMEEESWGKHLSNLYFESLVLDEKMWFVDSCILCLEVESLYIFDGDSLETLQFEMPGLGSWGHVILWYILKFSIMLYT